MSFLKNIFYPPPELSDEEKADQEEQQWYDDYNGWCDYNEETNQCTSAKVIISDDAITGKLFNMFNEFLAINKNAIIKHNKSISVGRIYTSKTLTTSYCLAENSAKQFITKVIRDDWNIYLQLNELYGKHRFIYDDNVYYIPLDVFVYGFSKYNDLMEVLSFDEQPIPNMPLQSKKEPEKNAHVFTRKSHNVNTFVQSPEVKVFELYLKKSPEKKKEYVVKVSEKLKKYLKSLSKKKDKQVNLTVDHQKPKFVKKELNAIQQNTLIPTSDHLDEDDEEIKVDENYVRRKLNINTSMYNKDFGGIIKDGGNVKRASAIKGKSKKKKQ